MGVEELLMMWVCGGRRIQFNSEEQWTKALKFLLTNLKWGLAWVSSQFSEEQLCDAPDGDGASMAVGADH